MQRLDLNFLFNLVPVKPHVQKPYKNTIQFPCWLPGSSKGHCHVDVIKRGCYPNVRVAMLMKQQWPVDNFDGLIILW